MKKQQQKTRNKGMKQNMKSKERCTVYKTFFYAPCLKTSSIQYAYYACKYITCTVYTVVDTITERDTTSPRLSSATAGDQLRGPTSRENT